MPLKLKNSLWKDGYVPEMSVYIEYPANFEGRKYKGGYYKMDSKKGSKYLLSRTLINGYWQFTEFVGKETGYSIDFSEMNFPDIIYRYINFNSVRVDF